MSLESIRPKSDPFGQTVNTNKKLLTSGSQEKGKDLYFIFDEKTGQIQKGAAQHTLQKEIAVVWKDKTVHLLAKGDGHLSSTAQIALTTSLIAAGVSGQSIPDELKNLPSSQEETFRYVKSVLQGARPIDRKEALRLYKMVGEYPIAEQTDPSHPAIVIKHLVEVFEAVAESPEKAIKKTGLKAGEDFAGVNGSYFIKDRGGTTRFVFKPEQEEAWDPFHSDGYPVGGGARREQVASILGGEHVPVTLYVELDGKLGSLQTFVSQAVPALVLNARLKEGQVDKIPLARMQEIAFFHGRINNEDAHLGNILIQGVEEGEYRPWAIDHGTSFGEKPVYNQVSVDYMHFPQMHTEIDPSVAKKILSLDPKMQREVMRKHGLSEEAIDWANRSTSFQQYAVTRNLQLQKGGKKGFTPFELLGLQTYCGHLIRGGEKDWKILLDAIVELREAHGKSHALGQEALTKLRQKYRHPAHEETLISLYDNIVRNSK